MRMRPANADERPLIWPISHGVAAAGETYCWDPDTDETAARHLWMIPPPAEVWIAVKEVGGRVRSPGAAAWRPWSRPG